MIFIEGIIRGVITKHNKQKTDEFTGVITPASTTYKVQIEHSTPTELGEESLEIKDFNLKDNQAVAEAYRKHIGSTVRCVIALWNIDGKAGLYIPQGLLPIILKPAVKAA